MKKKHTSYTHLNYNYKVHIIKKVIIFKKKFIYLTKKFTYVLQLQGNSENYSAYQIYSIYAKACNKNRNNEIIIKLMVLFNNYQSYNCDTQQL